MNVIVFEREEDIQDLLSYNLTKYGLNVTSCFEKDLLCSCLDSLDPQLIIIGNLDWDQDIVEFAKGIRAQFENHNFSVVALTTDDDSIPKMSQSGLFDKVLATPLTPKYLISEISELIEIPLQDAA